MANRLYDGSTFERNGYEFRVDFRDDDCMGEPWKEHDGHGIVSEWTRRAKAPGERVLVEDRGTFRYYDVAKTLKLARKDGWGCSHDGHRTKREGTACAVDEDFARMRGWANGDWQWISVVVTLLDEDGDETDETESLSGIESDSGAYLTEVAEELADEILGRIEVDEPDILLSEN